MIRMLFLGATILVSASACAAKTDLSHHYNEETISVCGVSVGQPLPPDFQKHPVLLKPEGIPEQRFTANFCEGEITGHLALGDDGQVEWMSFSSPGYCLDGVCIGDTFPDVRTRRPDLEVFLTSEEGGILSLRQSPGSIRYPFDTGNTPIRCFAGIDICSDEWRSVRVAAIVVSS